MQRKAETTLFGHQKINMKTAVHKTSPLGVLSVGLLENFIHPVCACAFSHMFPLYACYAHSLRLWNRCTHTDGGMCVACFEVGEWKRMENSPKAHSLPIASPFHFSVLFAPFRSLSWFDLKQNSILQFHTLSAVDKAPCSLQLGPREGTVYPRNGRKSNSSRQWGLFVELSQMKGPYLASHCFSHHFPVSYCWLETNKSLFKAKKSI